ncbi:hypothetical protein K2173_016745 [Erythroxylum novogranatense]|uniref:C2H2-type domain-containing protein n=1 Tax=Erythroxylum novogranatense TaxID=1862640 RepID=A0AAV8SHU3_9ROSI|nr:hypothetical protein K2173_016745 [Erythroxylum novogranatense]
MDAAAKKKALFRARLNAQKKDKQRIDSPLVRYNEFDQPVCRVCNIVLKSESLWDAHQASRKHHEAISNFKANATGHTQPAKPKLPVKVDLPDTKDQPSVKLSKPSSSSVLPPDFFDTRDSKKQRLGSDAVKSSDLDASKTVGTSTHATTKESSFENKRNEPLNEINNQTTSFKQISDSLSAPEQSTGLESKQVKGALPEGFFDNKEADLRARGIKTVKPDVKDEYKEFEKLIQEDLREVDDRLEEEEIDAAEMIQEFESLEQSAYREKVELLKRRKIELMAARSSKRGADTKLVGKESVVEESSSDDDENNNNFAVDWRAQHL